VKLQREAQPLQTGEDNRDGATMNCARTSALKAVADAAIASTPRTGRRAMAATLLWHRATPDACAGDEIGNSQLGNNNAYCQDNPTGWLDWAKADDQFPEIRR